MTSIHNESQIASCPSRCLIRNESFYEVKLPMSVAFSPDGSQIASTVGDKEPELVYIWCVVTGELLRHLDGHSNWVTSITFSSDGRRIASGSWDDTAQIWDATIGVGSDMARIEDEIQTKRTASKSLDWLTSHQLLSCVLSRDGSCVVIVADTMVYVWNHVTNT
jgi:WD40 repeat protein